MWQFISESQLSSQIPGTIEPTIGTIIEDRFVSRSKTIGYKRILMVEQVLEKQEEDKERGKEKGWLCKVKEMKSVRLVPRR